jgi:FMN phosphatase YigB (HAD superfamily)
MARVSSFDVFDTLLTRSVSSPRAVFLLLGRMARAQGLTDCGPVEFAAARSRAEARAYERAKAGGRQLRLTDIHRELQAELALSDAARQALERAECELESRLVFPVPGARAVLEEARLRGDRIAFVTEMYLPEDFLRGELERHGLMRPGELLLVSGACGFGKADAGIYRHLVELSSTPAGSILHHGDDPRLDGECAGRAGLSVRTHADCALNRYERILEAESATGAPLGSLMAGASRRARLRVEAAGERELAIRDVAAGVVAPLLCAYVLWVLREAQRQSLADLYFLARDGQILLDIARRLAPKLGAVPELHYLHASRQAWNLPAFAAGAHGDLNWIWDRTDDLSVRSLLARVDLEPDDVREHLVEAGLPAAEWSRALTTDEIRGLRELLGRASLRERVLAAAEGKLDLAARYLVQAGVPRSRRAGLVELVGHGNLQESASALIARAGGAPPPPPPPPTGLYFAWIADSRKRAITAPLVYLRDSPDSRDLVPGWGVIALEAFCAADHGTTIEYAEEAGTVVPVLEQAGNPPVSDWGLGLMRQTVAEFADALVLDQDLVDPDSDARPVTLRALREFWMRPKESEARAWGSFPWEDGFGKETRYQRLARGYEWSHVGRAARDGRIHRFHRAAWPAASLVLTPPLRRFALRAAAKISRLARPRK